MRVALLCLLLACGDAAAQARDFRHARVVQLPRVSFDLRAQPANGQVGTNRDHGILAGSQFVSLVSQDSADGTHDGLADMEDEAEVETPPETTGEWEFTLTPYLWMTSLSSSVSAGPLSFDSDICFTEILKHVNMAVQLRFEGVRNNWGFYLDGTYINLGEDATARIGRFRIRGLDAEAEFTQAWVDFGGFYRLGDNRRSFDIMLGGRYLHVSTEVSVGPFFETKSTHNSVIPVVGSRFLIQLHQKWMAGLKGEIGGFGVGNAADLVWGATAFVGYRLNERTTLTLGYRYYDIDLSDGTLDADIQFHGPIVGVAYTF